MEDKNSKNLQEIKKTEAVSGGTLDLNLKFGIKNEKKDINNSKNVTVNGGNIGGDIVMN